MFTIPTTPIKYAWLLIFSIILTITINSASSFAEVEIKNIATKLDTLHGKKIVRVSYDITGNDDPNGADISFGGTLTNPDNEVKEITILNEFEELEGSIGEVKGNGKKEFIWHAEQTIMNYLGPNNYKCVITLTIGNIEPTGATIEINKLKTDKFEDKGDVLMKDLVKTGTFQSKCGAGKGDWFTSTVESDATFYMSDNVQSFPWYIGNVNYAGAPTGQGCTSFIACKDLGGDHEKVWVCFSNEHNRKAQHTDVWSEWELQIRCFRKKVDTGMVEYAVLGFVNRKNEWLPEDYFEDYKLTIATKGKSTVVESDEFDISIIRKVWYYPDFANAIYKFEIKDMAPESGWKGSGENKIRCDNILVSINDFLYFDGGYIEIDTLKDGAAAVQLDGRLYLKDIPELFSDEKKDLVIWNGPFSAKIAEDAISSLITAQNAITYGFAMCGFAVLPHNIKFLGAGTGATGVKLDIDLLINALQNYCDSPTNLKINNVMGIRLLGLTITQSSGFGLDGVNIQNVGIPTDPFKKVSNIDVEGSGGICIRDLLIQNDKPNKTWIFNIELQAKPFVESAGGGFRLLDGNLDAFRIIIKAEPGYGVPLPTPYPAPVHFLEWLGGEIKVDSMQKGPLMFSGSAYFAPNKLTTPYPFSKYAKFFEIIGTFNVKISSSTIIDLIATANIFKVGDIWIKQYEGKISIDFGGSITISGAKRIWNFQGKDWLLEGNGKIGITFKPEYAIYGGIQGLVKVPELFRKNTFFKELNTMLKLPWTLADVRAEFKNTKMAFTADLGVIGKWGLYADMNMFGTPGFLEISKGSAKPLLKKSRINDTPIPIIYSDVPEYDGIALSPAMTKKGSESIQSEPICVTIPVDNKVDRLFVKIYGQSSIPSSYILSPSGIKTTETKQDSSIVKYIGKDEDANTSIWLIVHPTVGEWKACIENPKTTDSVYVFALNKQRDDEFVLKTKSDGRKIIYEWDSQNASDSSKIDLYIDADNGEYDGIYIGSALEKLGKFTFEMDDSLALCQYYAYGVRWDDAQVAKSYSGTKHFNLKSHLPPPQNITAISDANGHTKVCWDHSIDSTVTGYIVMVRDEFGRDSVYTHTNRIFNCVEIDLVNQDAKQVSVLSVNAITQSGCWSEFVGVVTGLEPEAYWGKAGRQNAIEVSPNPVEDIANIRVYIDNPTHIQLAVYDLIGNRIYSLADGSYEAGSHKTSLDCSSMQSGVYIVKLESAGEVKSQIMVIPR